MMSQNPFKTEIGYPNRQPNSRQNNEVPQSQKSGVHHFLVIENHSNRYIISLESSTYSIGRDLRSSIVLASKWVSRQHAILLRVPSTENNQYSFRVIDGDLQGKRSTNGLWINGQRCFSHNLKPGDTINFGKEVTARYYLVSQLSTNAFKQGPDLSELTNQEIPEDDLKTVLLNDEGQDNESSEMALFRLASFPELIPTPIIEVNFEGTITYINPAALKQFPTLQEDRKGHPLLTNLKVGNTQETRQYFVREVRIGKHYFQQFIHYIYESDLIRSYIFDITDQKRTEASLRRSEAKNRALLNAIPDLMLQIDSRGKILDFKPAKDFDISASNQIIHRDLQDVFPTSIAQQMSHYLKRSLQTRTPQVFEYELPNHDSIFHYEVRLVTSSDNELLMIIRNITERKVLEQQLIHDAFHDALTGLPNRPLFMNHLAHVFELRKRREHYLYAILFIDLDRFKVINDSLGHLVGDQLLIGIARRLESCLRVGDTVARLGGDEFAILLEDISGIEDAIEVADRLQQELAQPFHLENHEVFTTASIGIAPGDLDYDRPEELLRDADIAMYHAKSLGKARYQVFDRSMHTHVVTFLRLDGDLRRAIERQEFQLYYQPIVSLQSGLITGFETLVRWQHPEQGLIPPEKFIQIAEETGLIIPIGEWILYEACYQAHQWHQRFPQLKPLNISINLSGKQFAQPNLVQQIHNILSHTGLNPRRLKLEITESVLMETSKHSTNTLHELKALNLDLCIDDFGTGYSSLSYLHHFPIDILKADRSFVRTMGLDEEPSSRNEITRTIVMLAHNLGIQVVAEGVETAEQLTQLRQLGCEYGQGFFFARPLSREDAEALMLKQPRW